MVKTLKRWLGSGILWQEKGRSKCLACGTCCELFGGHLHSSSADIERWKRLGRKDLLSRVNRLGWIWVDPRTGQREDKCPFLVRTDQQKAQCSIHEIKPDICRSYPTLAHGRRCPRGIYLNLCLTFLAELFTEASIAGGGGLLCLA